MNEMLDGKKPRPRRALRRLHLNHIEFNRLRKYAERERKLPAVQSAAKQ
jgi:hypothetical protein